MSSFESVPYGASLAYLYTLARSSFSWSHTSRQMSTLVGPLTMASINPHLNVPSPCFFPWGFRRNIPQGQWPPSEARFLSFTSKWKHLFFHPFWDKRPLLRMRLKRARAAMRNSRHRGSGRCSSTSHFDARLSIAQ